MSDLLSVNPVSSAPHRRRARWLGSCLTGAAALLLVPGIAHADDCGGPVDGTITCPASGSPYPGGIFYFSGTSDPIDLTVVLGQGTVVDTGAAALPAGVWLVNTNGDITLDTSGASISTSANYAGGVIATAARGDIDATLGDVTSSGRGAPAVSLSANTGSIDLTVAGTIHSSGDYAQGVLATASGDVHVTNNGTIASSGGSSPALDINATGDVTLVNNGDITASGNSWAWTQNGATRIHGDNVDVTNHGTMNATGDYARAIRVYAQDEIRFVSDGTVSASGANAMGVVLETANNYATVTADVQGPVNIAGRNSTGVNVLAGTAHVTVGDVTATADNNTMGVFVSGSHGATVDATGLIQAHGDGAVGMRVAGGAGTADVTLHDMDVGGFLASGLIVESNVSNVTVTGTVRIDTHNNDYGLFRQEGALRVLGVGLPTSSAHVTIDKGAAIYATGYLESAVTIIAKGLAQVDATGKLRVDGGGAMGVHATSYGGNLVLNAADIATVGEDSRGIGAVAFDKIAVHAGKIVTQGDDSVGIFAQSGGDVTVAADDVTVTGATATGIVVSNYGNASVTAGKIVATDTGGHGVVIKSARASVDATSIASSDTAIGILATSSAAVTIRGQVTSANAEAVRIRGTSATLQLTAGGSILGKVDSATFDLGSAGIATIDNAGTLAGGSGYAVHMISGVARLSNSGRVTGAVQFGAGADSFANSGTFDMTKDSDFGAGTDLFTNQGGTVRVLAAATTPGTVSLLGLEKFANVGGTIDLRNGHAGDALSLSGSYVGSDGAKLALDVSFASGTTDQLRVAGTATGSTAIQLNVLNGTPGLTSGGGIAFAKAGAGSAADAFTIANPDIGLVHFDVAYDAAAGSYALTGAPGAGAWRAGKTIEGAQSVWNSAADAVAAHGMLLHDRAEAGEAPGSGIWGDITVGRDDRGDSVAAGSLGTLDLGYRQDFKGVQGGVDFALGDNLVVGVTLGYVDSKLRYDGADESTHFETIAGGGYAAFGGTGWFVNAQAQYAHYRVKTNSAAVGYAAHFGGDGYGAAAEAGARWALGGLFVEPVASLAWSHVTLDDVAVGSATIDFDDASGLRGKAGLRVGGTAGLGDKGSLQFHAAARAVHEFAGDYGLTLVTGSVSQAIPPNHPIGTYGQAELGVTALTASRVSLFATADLDFAGDYHGGGGRIGIRFGF